MEFFTRKWKMAQMKPGDGLVKPAVKTGKGENEVEEGWEEDVGKRKKTHEH